MKVVILAGGFGTRISEETHLKPKPMVEIGGKPILWHILKIYSHYGINEFIICCGYKGYLIKEYFANYFLHMNDVTFDLNSNIMEVHDKKIDPWKITLIDTGDETKTGGRLLKVKKYIGNETFCFTYGDGLSNVNINETIDFHKNSGAKATITAVRPPGRYGSISINENLNVTNFQEKPKGDGGWINGGFFVLEPSVIDYVESSKIMWENQPLKTLSRNKELCAFKHYGFWHPMDTLRDKNYLNDLWIEDKAPWNIWNV